MKHRNKRRIFSIIFTLFLLTLISFISVSYKRTTTFHSRNVSGNLAGNLYNNGVFCEYNDKIYFSNSYDEGDLYVMNLDGTNISKLYDDTVSYINVVDKYIYYARNNLTQGNLSAMFRGNLFGVYRLNLNGKNLVRLNEHPSGVVSFGNNEVFYQHYDNDTALTLKSVSSDGSQKKELSKDAINPSCIVNGIMYYSNISDKHKLMARDIANQNTWVVYDHPTYHPIYEDNYIYFMDLDHNYSLARINLTTLDKEDLNTGRIDTFNLYQDYIYVQKNDAKKPLLCRMKKDGTQVETILSGNFCNINITSQYVYFNQFGHDTPIYRIKTSGDIEVARFDEAADAIKNTRKFK